MGNGGWVRWQDEGPLVTFVRFEDREGRLRPVDVFLVGDIEPIQANHMRAVPLGQIEAWANSVAGDRRIRYSLGSPRPLLREAVAFFGSSADEHASDWWARMYVSQFEDELGGVLESTARPKKVPALRGKGAEGPTDHGDLRIDDPGSKPYGEDFYREVVRVYQAAAAVSDRPNVLIAQANGFAESTVRGWVRTARARKLMAPGRRGSVG